MIHIVTQFVQIPVELQDRFKALLGEAMSCDEADKSSLQFYNEEEGLLRIIGYSGFTQAFLDHFASVKPFDSSACGRAIAVGSPVFISDVSQDMGFEPNKEIARVEGFAAVLSLPILDDERNPLGVISLHYMEPKWTWNLNKLDNVIKEVCHALHDLRQYLRIHAEKPLNPSDSTSHTLELEENLS